MRLSRPSLILFLLSLIAAAISAANTFGVASISLGGISNAEMALIAWVVLAIGVLMR